jgi:hypothetical protein
MRIFGEAGVVKLKTSTTPKTVPKGATCMFVGYAPDHPKNCFVMYNPKTKGSHLTRDGEPDFVAVTMQFPTVLLHLC